MIAVAGDGTVYVTRRTVGDVVMLRDADGDGAADGPPTVVASRPGMHGIAIDGETVYLVTVKDVYRTRILDDGTFAALELLADDLPDAGQHPNRMVVVGPDGMLYLTAGSTCNACAEPNPENATMLRMAPDGSSRTIFASGLRNTIGYGFEPETGEVFGMDHGTDWLGDNEQHEELNQIVEGNRYGWPYVFADGMYNPQDYPPGGITMPEWEARSAEAIGLYTPHAAPMQLAFYTGEQFPEEYRGDAFVATRGSWNRRPPSGYEVVRVQFEDGRPVGFEPFVQGFLVQEPGGEWGHLGRLCGLAQTPDGALLLSDDTNGVVYRIAYQGAGGARGRAPGAPTNVDGADPAHDRRALADAAGRHAGRVGDRDPRRPGGAPGLDAGLRRPPADPGDVRGRGPERLAHAGLDRRPVRHPELRRDDGGPGRVPRPPLRALAALQRARVGDAARRGRPGRPGPPRSRTARSRVRTSTARWATTARARPSPTRRTPTTSRCSRSTGRSTSSSGRPGPSCWTPCVGTSSRPARSSARSSGSVLSTPPAMTDLTLDHAQAVLDAARQKAEDMGIAEDIAVVDAGANLKAFCRMDGAWLGSIDIAITKAKTARWFDMPTGDLGEMSQPGGSLYGIEHSNGGLVTFPGGLPLKNADGTVIGAVGASGSTVDDDHAVAQAGADALGL